LDIPTNEGRRKVIYQEYQEKQKTFDNINHTCRPIISLFSPRTLPTKRGLPWRKCTLITNLEKGTADWYPVNRRLIMSWIV
jgi:hypothetical protein